MSQLLFGAAAFAAVSFTVAGAAAAEPNAAMAALYEKAKVEGEVMLSGPAEVEIGWIPIEFEKRFPGIEVKTLPDLQAATKIIAEARAGRHSFDVWTNSLGGMIEVQKRGLLQRVDWPGLGLDAANVFFDGDAVTTHNFVYSAVYAKDRLATRDLPISWDALADPRWKGKLTAQNFLLPRLMGFLALAWGPDRTRQWGHALIDDNKLLVTSTPAESLLKSGERLLAVGDSVSLAYSYSADGVDSGYVVMDIVPAAQFVVAALKDAPHPNAATLLAAWMASEEGRDLFERIDHQADIRPGAKSALAREIAAAHARVILEDVATMDERAAYYKSFSALVRGEQ